jgi:hypothetical protein
LREVLGKPAPQPPAEFNLPKIDGPTSVWDPGSQGTITNATAPMTRISDYRPPPPSNETQPVVRPWEITADHIQGGQRNPRIWIIGAAIATVLAAVITFVVIATNNHGTGSAAPPLPAFSSYQENLGFSIVIPQGYTRHASTVGAQSDVVWQAPQPDPRIGPLVVQVLRDDTPGITPSGYLSARDRSASTDSNNAGYQRLSPTGPTELEYTYNTPASGDQLHVRIRAVAGGSRLYMLTFTLYAQDTPTLQAQWQRMQPIMAHIQDSLRVSP